MSSFFIKIYHFIAKNKLVSVLFALVLLGVFGYFSSKIVFEEDITKILPKSEAGDITTKVVQQLNFSDKISILITKSGDTIPTVDLTQMAGDFIDGLSCCTEYIRKVHGQVDDTNIKQTFDFVYDHLPYFLDIEDYQRIEEKIAKDSVELQVENNLRTLMSPTGIVAKDFIVADPLGISFIALQKLRESNVSDNFQLIDGYLVTQDESTLLIFIDPVLSGSETERNADFVNRLNEIKDRLNASYDGKTQIEYFGPSFIAVANADQIKTDITTTVLVSLSILMLLLMLYYKKIYVPLIIFIPSLFGGLCALMCMYFLKDSISAISLSIGAVLLGVTIDYSLHILTHYKNISSIELLYKDIVKPLIMSSTTTAVAFLCLLFVHSEALQDLGIFASISVVMSAIFSIVIIPHLYRPKSIEGMRRKSILDRLAVYEFEKNKFLIFSCLALIAVSVFTFNKVGFDDDLAKLNYVPEDIKATERKLEQSTDLTSKSLYLVLYGENVDEVLQNNLDLAEQLRLAENNEDIISYNSVSSIVLSQTEQAKRFESWQNFWGEQKREELQNNLVESGQRIGFKTETHQRFYDLISDSIQSVELERYIEIEGFFTDEFINERDGFYTVASIVKVEDEKRASFVKSIAESRKDVVVIDRKQLNETYLGHLKDDFNSLINYSFIAVILILWYFFRRLELVLISLIPIILTGFVTMGVMGLFDIQLNIFSTIVTTLIFGHGIDFTIFMTSALQKEHTYGKSELTTYRTSILLAVLTTILAIGALVFAHHPALKSISLLALIGVMSALVITFVFYPMIFRFFITQRVKNHKSPVTFRMFFHAVVSFVFYGLGSLFVSAIGGFLVKILPGKMEEKMKVLRKGISKFLTSVMYLSPYIGKKTLSGVDENFEKPAIIISNHTSFLDSITLNILSSKIIFLVNDWVYNSPFFGKVVQLAGFYPVSQGVEGSVDHLKEKVDNGYSLMIFPEGTRSETNQIQRFHKGAFYLAEQLDLDIMPLYIHGNSEMIPKGDFVIFNGNLNVVIDPRISPNDTNFGKDYSERAKKISRYFKSRFQEIRMEIEDENYFEKKLYLTYLYKEPEIISAVKSDFEKNKMTYYAMFKQIPTDAKIFHFGNDYGQIDLLLTWQFPSRKITTYISDENKRDAAKVNYPVGKRKLAYTDIMLIEDEKTNTILISSDVYEVVVVPPFVKFVFLLKEIDTSIVLGLEGFYLFVEDNGLKGYRRNE